MPASSQVVLLVSITKPNGILLLPFPVTMVTIMCFEQPIGLLNIYC